MVDERRTLAELGDRLAQARGEQELDRLPVGLLLAANC